MSKKPHIFLIIIFGCVPGSFIFAQDKTPTPTPTPAASVQQDDGNQTETETTKIRRKRRRAARPAEYQGAGVLQVEYGYNGNFKAKDSPDSQSVTFSLNFAATDKLQLEFANDNFVTQTDASNTRQGGFGNTYLGFQYTLQSEKKKRPAFAFSYQATLPTGSESKGISNGRDSHQLTGIISKEDNETDINFNTGLLLNGRQNLSSYDKGVQVALGFSRDLKKGYGLQWEIYGNTIDASQPKGMYASATLTYQKNNRWLLDFGTNIGLTSAAPRFGVFMGITFNAVNVYKSKK